MTTMTSTTKNSDAQDFEKELKKTELGDLLLKYKNAVFAFIILVIVGIIGTGIYLYTSEKNEQASANALYTFEESTLKDFQDKKISDSALVTEFNKVTSSFKSTNSLMTTGLFVFDALVAQGANASALEVIKQLTPQNNYQLFLINPRLALAQELNGDIDGAIKSLEALNATGLKVSEGKTYTDLGRLYMGKGNKELAKKSFEYVKTVNTESVYKSLADYYLGTL